MQYVNSSFVFSHHSSQTSYDLTIFCTFSVSFEGERLTASPPGVFLLKLNCIEQSNHIYMYV